MCCFYVVKSFVGYCGCIISSNEKMYWIGEKLMKVIMREIGTEEGKWLWFSFFVCGLCHLLVMCFLAWTR